MKHIQLEPSENVVLHAMTLQDLRNCELMISKEIQVHQKSNVPMRQELARKLRSSLTRITASRIACEVDAATEASGAKRVVHLDKEA